MKGIFALVVIALLLMPQACAVRGEGCAENAAAINQSTIVHYPGQTWEKAESPEQLDWSSEKLSLARQYADSIGSAAVMIVVDGRVLAEWGETARRFNVHSIRKSLLSALYGIYVKEGKINLQSTMAELGIDDNAPSLKAEEERARVIDLLMARSGIYHAAVYETAAAQASRPQRGSHAPGTFLYYNNWDYNALGTIFEKTTGRKIFEAFQQRLAEPLQMEDYRLADSEYFRGPESEHPAYLFRLTARDLARFGLLFLRQGKWRKEQIVPQEWVAESTRAHAIPEGTSGYGYMWWVEINGKPFPALKDGAFMCMGAGEHLLLVAPDVQLVLVHRVNTDARGSAVTNAQLANLVKLIVEAKTDSNK